MSALYALGAREVIRDCEWIVRRADASDGGGSILAVDGLSELVSGKSTRFLTKLEEHADAIRLPDPAKIRFEQDLSPGCEKSRLFIETQLCQIPPADEHIYLGHKAAMDPVSYQLDLASQAIKQHRQRILIADAVVLSKILGVGVLMMELVSRGRGNRILVPTLKSMMAQFQKEVWNRFTVLHTRLLMGRLDTFIMLSATPHDVKARRVSPSCPSAPTEQAVEYKASFFRSDSEEDYRMAGKFLAY
ncbi:hypothetical protein ACGK9R_10550 [Halomonas sp. HNIBRBA4712]|uniref:hypothetical protein n=1 Tax=Halomonas sp. HNIBRBA4712 TaxID=3373087 RepID=UPI003746E830